MISIPVEQILRLSIAFLRIGGIMFALPFFGDRATPLQVRLFLTVAITIATFPTIQSMPPLGIPDSNVAFILLVLRELVIGLVFGYLARLIFEAFMMAADLVGYQMGFGTANLYMPDADGQGNYFTIFQRVMIVMIFLSLNLHHVFIEGIVDSFTIIPLGKASLGGAIPDILISQTTQLFAMTIQLAAPVLVAILFSTAALGLLTRAVPKSNVYSLNFPINFAIGLLIFAATLPFYPNWLAEHFKQSQTAWMTAFRALFWS